ncbi:MAG: preprotein translocase subunit SecG [Verrucomicrobia bacterium]|nr:MAG: preprotein translocase subunit SecG [Verrucomicrobiota bacterium]
MILAAIEWLPIIIQLLLVVFVLVCLLMTLLILMQRPKQEGLGAAFGASVTDQVFGARTTNVLQRGTVYLGSMFFILSLALAILIGHQNKQKGLTREVKPQTAAEKSSAAQPALPAPAAQVVPVAPVPEPPATPETPAAPGDATPAPAPTPEPAPAPAPAPTPAPTPAPAAPASTPP